MEFKNSVAGYLEETYQNKMTKKWGGGDVDGKWYTIQSGGNSFNAKSNREVKENHIRNEGSVDQEIYHNYHTFMT